jgi:diguanylate cyclase (GGDEF)-like protein
VTDGDRGALRWAQDCQQGGDQGAGWPAREATVLYRLVLAAPSGAEGDDLEAAARSFAVATGSMAVLARRMSSLRQVVSAVAGEEGLDRARVAAALDRATVAATQAALAQLEGAALTDPLTECGNRRALEMAAPAALALANRTGKPLSVVALDLDGLKVLNDTHGHAVGDRALAGLSAAARAALRATDQLFRIGGDEFVVLLPLAGEAHVADLVRRMELFNAPRFSWGAATMPADGTDLEALLRVADARLYESRRVAGYQRRPGVAAPPAGALAAIAHHWARAAVVAACSMAVVAVLAFVLGTRPGEPSPADGTTPSGQGSTTVPATGHGTGGGSGTGHATGSGSGSSSTVAGGGSGSDTTTTSTTGTGSGSGSGSGSGGGSTTTTTSPLPTTTITLPTTTLPLASTTTTSPLGGLLHGIKL